MIRTTLSLARLVPRLVGGAIHVAESSVRTALDQIRRLLPDDEAGPGTSARPMASLAPDIESPAVASQPAITRTQAPAPPALNGIALKPAEDDPSVEEMRLPSAEATLLEGHISEEPRLVAESADPGAVEGAGATLHVSEPWSGYKGQRATDVIDRLGSEELSVVAVVSLFEQFNRKRRSVLKAVERELARRERASGVE